MIAAALLLAAVYIVLTALRVFRGQSDWKEYSVIAATCVLSFLAAFLKLRRRVERRQSIKSTRDSLLKHRWELQHRREW